MISFTEGNIEHSVWLPILLENLLRIIYSERNVIFQKENKSCIIWILWKACARHLNILSYWKSQFLHLKQTLQETRKNIVIDKLNFLQFYCKNSPKENKLNAIEHTASFIANYVGKSFVEHWMINIQKIIIDHFKAKGMVKLLV